ncbi:MAG: hypothetical protein ABGX36_07995 [Cycloclasticus sp.]|jgi:hypothetical protein
MKTIIKTGLAAILGFAIAAPAFAIDTGIKGLTQSGRVKVGASVLYDLESDGNKLGPSNWVIESKTTYRPNRQWTFIANFWLRGDLSTEATSYQSTGGGLADALTPAVAAPAPYPGFTFPANKEFKINNCAAGTFCRESSDLQVLNDWEEVIRELSVKYRDKKGRFSIKFGKQQRGWGESDGLRLIDLLHAQDLRERFAFRDSDETRIPALMLSMDFNLNKLGMAAPFEAIGMTRPRLEFNFTPEVLHSKFNINNPTPSEESSAGGIFGLPWPNTLDPVSDSGYVLFGFETPENTAKRLSFEDAEYSLRLKFETLGGVASLNAFYGMQDLPVLKLRGLDLYGDARNGLDGGPILGHFSAATTEAIVHGGNFDLTNAGLPIPHDIGGSTFTGGYLNFLRAAADPSIAPLHNPLTAALFAFSGGAVACADPLSTSLTNLAGAVVDCSVTAQVELDYDYRQMVVGATFTRDLSDFMKFGRKNSSPSMRLEISHEFDHPFNRSNVDPGAVTGADAGPLAGALSAAAKDNETGSGVLAVIPSRAITKADITSTMIGFDFPFWVPGWESQEKSIFTSIQFFDIYTHDSDQGLMVQAPYAFSTVQDHQNYMTFLWSMPLDSQRMIVEGLLVEDFTNDGTFYRQRVDFNYFGDSWRPRLEWMHFQGKAESAPIGIFDHSDFVELSLTYQF